MSGQYRVWSPRQVDWVGSMFPTLAQARSFGIQQRQPFSVWGWDDEWKGWDTYCGNWSSELGWKGEDG